MQAKLRDLLDKIYELEGLVHLALKREDEAFDFLRLISKKGNEVATLCASLGSDGSRRQSGDESSNILPNEVHDAQNYDIQDYDFQDFDFQDFDSGDYEIDLNEYSIDESSEEGKKSDEDKVREEDKNPQESNELREGNEPDEETTFNSESKKGKLVFSINERFRFRKELFNNSDADFNNTLALVASMEDYNEAEEYFIGEEGFDANNPVVKEFLQVIKRYFK